MIDPLTNFIFRHHGKVERNVTILLVLAFVAVIIGGIVEIVPLFYIENTIEKVQGMRPYTPLELAGRNIYVREGCYVCHSQQIRPLRDEVERYGHYSLAAESMYDHPFQWGSKRTGPDLARVGNRYSDAWHVQHLRDPRSVVPGTIMPRYGHLSNNDLEVADIAGHLKVNALLGVPYTKDMIDNAAADLKVQASAEDDSAAMQKRYPKAQARDFDGDPKRLTEMDALVAYLQMLGTLVDFTSYEPLNHPECEVAMNTYEILRHFADSWGLLAMALVFVAILLWTFRPGSRTGYVEQANIPFKIDADRGSNHG